MGDTTFGRYRLLNPLGEGPSGRVFRAFDADNGRFVAIKLMSPVFVDDEALHRRFLRQVGSAAGLEHPNVMPIHDFGDVDGQLYVVMGLADWDLATRLAAGALGTEGAVRVTAEVARALDAAHRIGLVHGDLKPSNILLDAEETAHVVDFGCGAGHSSVYRAPEVAATGAGPSSDVYSLARVMQDCLDIKAFDATAGAGIDAVLARGMHPDPDQRYQSAIVLAQAAASALGSTAAETAGPPPPAPATPPEPTAALDQHAAPPPAATPAAGSRPWWRRNVVAVTVAAASLAVAVAVPAILVATGGPAPGPALLSNAEIDTVMRNDHMVLLDRVDHALHEFGPTFPAACTSVATFAGTSTYDGFQVTSIRTALHTEPGNNPAHVLWQSIVAMDSPKSAQGYLAATSGNWKACKGRPFAVAGAQYVMNVLDTSDHLLTAGFTTADGGLQCQRVTAAARHQIIEMQACGPTIADEAKTAAATLIARVG